jgi:hypothetical protein
MTLIFLHIPKTAGTTLNLILMRQFIGQPVYELYDPEPIARFYALPQAERDRYACLIGHVRFGLHRLLSGESRYITMLRDPVERAVSAYYFVRKLDDHPHRADAHTLSLVDFVAKYHHGQRQTRMLTSAEDFAEETRPRDPLPPGALDVALHNLETQIAVFGLTEQFDLSLLLFQRALGWDNVHYVGRNANAARPRQFDATTEAQLRELCATDIALYDFARARFEAWVAALKPEINGELARFQARNRLYTRLYGPTERLRATPLYRAVRRALPR